MLDYASGFRTCGRKRDDLSRRGEICQQAGNLLPDMRENPSARARSYQAYCCRAN